MIALEFATPRPPGAAAYYCLVVRDPYTVGAAPSCDVCLQCVDMPPQLASLTVLRDDSSRSASVSTTPRGEQQQPKRNGYTTAAAAAAATASHEQATAEDDDDDVYSSNALVLRVTALAARATTRQHAGTTPRSSRRSSRRGSTTSDGGHDTTTTATATATTTVTHSLASPPPPGRVRVCGRELRAAGEHAYARDGDVVDCGAHVSFVVHYRPLLASIERDAFTADYARDLAYMFHRLGATVCALPVMAPSYNNNNDNNDDNVDDNDTLPRRAGARWPTPIARVHCTEELRDSVACVRALAGDVTIVQPTYVFEWFAALAQSAASPLSVLPPPHLFAVPVRRVSAYATSTRYVRPESATCPFSLYAIPPSALLPHTRSRARLFARRHVLLLAPATYARYADALRCCGAAVYDASDVSTVVQRVRGGGGSGSGVAPTHNGSAHAHKHDNGGDGGDDAVATLSACELYVIVDADMEAQLRRGDDDNDNDNNDTTSMAAVQRALLQQQGDVDDLLGVSVPVALHTMGEHTLFTSLLTNTFRVEPIPRRQRPQQRQEQQQQQHHDKTTAAMYNGDGAVAARATSSSSRAHGRAPSLHEPSYIDVSQASSDVVELQSNTADERAQQQQQHASCRADVVGNDAHAATPITVPALDTAVLAQRMQRHSDNDDTQQQPTQRRYATPRASARRSLQYLPYNILHTESNDDNNGSSRSVTPHMATSSTPRAAAVPAGARTSRYRHYHRSDDYDEDMGSLLPRTPNRTPSRSQMRCCSRKRHEAGAAAAAQSLLLQTTSDVQDENAYTSLPQPQQRTPRQQQHQHRRSHSNKNVATAALGTTRSATWCAAEYDTLRTRIYGFLLKEEPPLDVATASYRRNRYVAADDVDRALEVRATAHEFLARLDVLYAQPAAAPYARALRQFAVDCATMDNKARWLVRCDERRVHTPRRRTPLPSSTTPLPTTTRRNAHAAQQPQRTFTPRTAASTHSAAYRSGSRPSTMTHAYVPAPALTQQQQQQQQQQQSPPPPQTRTTAASYWLTLHPHYYNPQRTLLQQPQPQRDRGSGSAPSRRRRVSASPTPRYTVGALPRALHAGVKSTTPHTATARTTRATTTATTTTTTMRDSEVWRPTRNTCADTLYNSNHTSNNNVQVKAADVLANGNGGHSACASPRPRRSASATVTTAPVNPRWRY